MGHEGRMHQTYRFMMEDEETETDHDGFGRLGHSRLQN